MIFRLGELFCGPGGIAFGATNAKIENENYRITHQWANDYDANTCDTYRKNICPSVPNTVYHEDGSYTETLTKKYDQYQIILNM